MSSDERTDRFLIGLAKFLGENPTRPNPLARVQVCKDWFLSELLQPILNSDGAVNLNLQNFNQLMLGCGRPMAKEHFFEHFFGTVVDVPTFEDAVEKFRIKAMWLFGNFQFAYKQMAGCDREKFNALISRTCPRTDLEEQLRAREPFSGVIQPIPEEDLGFLGYISSGELDDFAFAVDTLKQIVKLRRKDDRDGFLRALGADNHQKIVRILKSKGLESESLEGLENGRADQLIARLEPDLTACQKRRDNAQTLGIRNTQRYLTLPYLDVYVATSMRTQTDYVEQHRFVEALFSNAHVKDLNLYYFDPTASYDADRIKKGLIENLMLRRAAVTVYNAGAEDTMGKDSELAATLAQGKPVIVYVQSDPRFVHVPGRTELVDMEKRARVFSVTHPLGLQICTRTGVAHGVIVVRNIDQCAQMLRKVLVHDLSFSIKHEGGNFLLQETETGSVLRVATDDPLLSHSFWTYFRHTEPEPDI